MENVTNENLIRIALQSKLTSASNYLIRPGDKVRDCTESTKKWNGPYRVTRVSQKIMSFTDGVKVNSIYTKTF